MADHYTIEVGGIRLAYRMSGPPDAPALVLLHALGESATSWDGVVNVLAHHRRVYALTLRGHGPSDWRGNYSLEHMRDDVLGFLDALGLDRVDLIGHSMGGAVAYLLAEDHPQRVSRLVLEDVPAPFPRERTIPTRPNGRLPYDWQMVLAVRRQIDDPDPAWWDRLTEITAPALLIAGGPQSPMPQDRIVELARRIPDGQVLTIPAGHMVHNTRPDEFTNAVLAFLSTAEAGQAK